MQDGRIGRFEVPEGTTPENAQSLIEQHLSGQQQQAQQPQEQGFTQRVGQDISQYSQVGKDIIADPNLNPIVKPLAYVGKVGGELGAKLIGEAVPQPVKDIATGAANLVQKGASYLPGMESYNKAVESSIAGGSKVYDKLDPNLKALVESAGGIAKLGGSISAGKAAITAAPTVAKVGVKGLEVAGTAAEKTGEKLIKSSADDILKNKAIYSEEFIMPRETVKTAEKQISGGKVTEGGLFSGRKVELTPYQKDIANEVNKIEGISPDNTFLTNTNLVIDEVGKKTASLQKTLENSKVIFSKKEVKSKLNAEMKDIIDNEILLGDVNIRNTAKRLLGEANKIIDNNPSTPSGLLQARKQFDVKIRETFGDIYKDDTKVKAMNIINDRIRTKINSFIEEKVPDLGVKQSLREQHLLLKALDNTIPKAAREAKTGIGRFYKKIEKGVTVKGAIGATLATGGLGLSGLIAPVAAIGATGAGLYGLKKAVTSPTAKKAYGKSLKGVSNLLPKDKK